MLAPENMEGRRRSYYLPTPNPKLTVLLSPRKFARPLHLPEHPGQKLTHIFPLSLHPKGPKVLFIPTPHYFLDPLVPLCPCTPTPSLPSPSLDRISAARAQGCLIPFLHSLWLNFLSEVGPGDAQPSTREATVTTEVEA